MAKNIAQINCSALIIGGSAGSLDVLLEIFPLLKPDIKFPIVIVIHRKIGNESLLIDLLQNRTKLKVCEAEEKILMQAGCVYVAVADYHLLIEQDLTFSLDYSEKINYSRPSIDVTFQSAAEIFNEQLVCILLSGSNSDGALGLKAVKHYNGFAVVQDPDTAAMPYMPEQALLKIKADKILNPSNMANFINSLN
jgi:two-component system chemotaxis response regulator CheB